MGNFVGIDLGTTNSVAAFSFAKVEVVTADDNTPPDRCLTRSVVASKNNDLIVGEEAYYQLKADPENVIISIKRLMGRGFGDEVVQKQLSRYGYKIIQPSQGTENSIAVQLGEKEYFPEEISAKILAKVVNNAQLYQKEIHQNNDQIIRAVITVPAYFNDKQRYATESAATKAGLAKPKLLPEPTAAAISYGFNPDSEEVKTILVYDFGGGTFDSSLITASGNQFIESGKAGDLWLGGDDIEYQIIELVKQKVAEEEDLESVDSLIQAMPYYQQVRFSGELKLAVEQAKIDLSRYDKAQIALSTPLLDDLGMAINVDVEIHREEFEAMILPMVERTIKIARDALKYSDWLEEDVDAVLMVGGSSQIPLVQEKVREAFGEEKVVVHPRPMYAVAEGAAIVSKGLTDNVGSVSRDYRIQLVDDPRYTLINRGDVLPVTKSHTFRTEADGQRLIHFKFSSPDEENQQEEYIGGMWLALEQSYPKGTEVELIAELDEENSSLQITAALKNDPSQKVSRSFSRGKQDEKISQRVEELINQLNEEASLTLKGVELVNQLAGNAVIAANSIFDENGEERPDRLAVAEQKLQELEAFASEDYDTAKFYRSEFQFVLDYCSQMLPVEQKQRIETLSSKLNDAIENYNLSGLQYLNGEAKSEYDNLSDSVQLVLASKSAVSRANQINPSQGKVMTDRFSRMVDAMNQGNGAEAERCFRELQPDLETYLDQDLPSGSVATGITR
ncbi:Hsp70 family protein [Euhalothece natronophila Z-M001]|uniref:Hsp70 family protein n=1 Tax=Euhalothece natronophila Z-M001 TaxID=522448 RepID=A0A5B8NNV2_9CHRO|nr:Hsp70 family protein [Euhalothece natronophila]QDZ40261.1 Hsp70 family protein [Euhalothece natronophila Z-M001]